MCKYHNIQNMDKCMKKAIATLSIIFKHNGFKILACCCGHNKYPMTIVYRIPLMKTNYELFSGKVIPRKARFYIKDKQGYYYIPETVTNSTQGVLTEPSPNRNLQVTPSASPKEATLPSVNSDIIRNPATQDLNPTNLK